LTARHLRRRPRRLRRTAKIRELVREVRLSPKDLVYPVFVDEVATKPIPIESMPGQYRLPLSLLGEVTGSLMDAGVPGVLLFGLPSAKDERGSSAFDPSGIVQRAVKAIRDQVGDELAIFTDVCLCQYTEHGHCGVVKGREVLNDETLEILQRVAVSQAAAGADVVAPSAMADGQVKAIREAMDDADFKETGIMAYSAKHASCFYSPFRDAAHSAPAFGDRRSYQMDFSNPNEAMREVELDVAEGADIVMVKPALAYLDLIRGVKERFGFPTAAYSVSGEYAMVKAAAQQGWIDEGAAVLELLTAIKRAGADIIITYSARDAPKYLK